jgi:hypothetical protein
VASRTIPAPGTILRGEDGCALVVAECADVLDALIELVGEEYGGEWGRDNPVLVKEAEGLVIEAWHSCSKAWKEAECVEDWDGYMDWWAPDGDGKRTVWVLNIDRSVYALGEMAEEAEKQGQVTDE